MRSAPLLTTLALAAACGKPAPPAPPVTLSAGADTLHVNLSQDAAATWLGGDRYVVISPGDDKLVLLDFGRHTVTPLRSGGHLQHPAKLFSLADTFFVSDWGRQRVTVWTPDGTFLRDMPFLTRAGGAIPEAVDAHERLYAALAPNPGADGTGNRDSAAVVRVASPEAAPDTVARLTPLELARVVTDQGTRYDRKIFAGEDKWGVLPDGTVWVARHYHNRVDWRDTSGTWHRGSQLPDRILEVTRVDRERFIAQFPPELRHTAELLQFAPIKPPFVRAFSGADGHVWLEKSRHVADSMQQYHEVGRDGTLIRTVEVHGWSRILAATPDKVLISTPDSSGGFSMGVAARVTPPRTP